MSEVARRNARTGAGQGGAAARVTALEALVERYRLLVETSAAMATGLDLAEALGRAAEVLTKRLGVSRCEFLRVDARSGDFVLVASERPAGAATDVPRCSASSIGLGGLSARGSGGDERRPAIRYRDRGESSPGDLALMRERHEWSCVSVPLLCGKHVVGALALGDKRRRRRWSRDELDIVQAVADQAAVVVAASRPAARPPDETVYDALTGLYTRDHFAEHLRRDVTLARRYGQELSLMMIDLDGFRAFAERHGGECGWQALIEVAQLLRRATRDRVDLVARFAEGEFAVILPQARASGPEPTAARNVAERIRAAVATQRFVDRGGRREASITVSIGVAGIGIGGYTAEELLRSAEKALYLPERGGGDRVHVFGT